MLIADRWLVGLLFLGCASAVQLRAPCVRVCTNTACRKAGSRDTLDLLRGLASATAQAADAAEAMSTAPLATVQAAYGASVVEACGCLGGCGSGPNCVVETADGESELFRDVYKPKSAVALLEHAGLSVPDAAGRAWLRRMYAMRSMRRNDPREAIALLTQALGEAGELKGRGASLLSEMLELRADLFGDLGDLASADADRKHAGKLRDLQPMSSAR